MSRSTPRSLVAGILFLFSLGLILLTSAVRANPTDEELIRAVVENGIRTMGEACIDDNHGNEAAYKSTAAAYWSASTPDATELAQRQARFQMLFATPDPTVLAEDVADIATHAASNPTDYPPDKSTAVADYTAPTPNWDPNDSPLQEKEQEIDNCQAVYGLSGFQAVDFGVSSYDYESVSISGSDAIVDVSIALWSDYDMGGSVERTSGTVPWKLWLRKEQGLWKIWRQDYALVP